MRTLAWGLVLDPVVLCHHRDLRDAERRVGARRVGMRRETEAGEACLL